MLDTKWSIPCKKIAAFIDKNLIGGGDIPITYYASMAGANKNCVVFSRIYDEGFVKRANELSELLVIAGKEYEGKLTCPHIISQNPRLDFVRVVNEFFVKAVKKIAIHPTTIIEEGAKVGKDASIGANCFIGQGVSIGDGAEIHHNVIIVGHVRIGQGCIIKSGAVIGEDGFGFEYDEEGKPLRFPHIGAIIIGDNVFIGSNTTIERATIDETVIGDNVKIDDLAQIGHNCVIGDNTMIAAGSITCGGVVIGKGCWVSPNVTIKQKLKIGDGSYIGMGSVVIRDVEPGKTVVGVPARELIK